MRNLVIVFWVSGILLCVGCKKEQEAKNSDPPPPTVSTQPTTTTRVATGPVIEPAHRRLVAVLRISETHTDTLPAALMDDPFVEPSEEPFTVEEGQVVFADDRSRLVLPPNVTAEKCTVLVVHSINYVGKGRVGDSTRYYGFESLPAELPISPGFTGDQLAYDLATAKESFIAAMLRIRLVGDTGKITLVGDARKGFTVNGKPLEARKPVELVKNAKAVIVSETAQSSKGIGAGAGEEIEIFPAQNYGPIQFMSTISTTWFGQFPVATQKAAGEVLP